MGVKDVNNNQLIYDIHSRNFSSHSQLFISLNVDLIPSTKKVNSFFSRLYSRSHIAASTPVNNTNNVEAEASKY